MKARINLQILSCALALTCIVSTGCRKKPWGVTPLPGSRVHNPGEAGPGGIMEGQGVQPGEGVGGQNLTPQGIPMGEGHPGWNEDRDTLKADTVYFDYDSSAIKDSEKSKIEAVAEYLKSNTSAAVKVEGNCDERGTEEYNRALGERRALAVREYLVHSGVGPDRVDTVSYGEDKPAAQGHEESAWKQNRRDDFVVLTPPK